MSQNDIYDNPLIVRYASQENGAALVAAGQVLDLAAALGRSGGGPASAGPFDHRRADRGASRARSIRSISPVRTPTKSDSGTM